MDKGRYDMLMKSLDRCDRPDDMTMREIMNIAERMSDIPFDRGTLHYYAETHLSIEMVMEEDGLLYCVFTQVGPGVEDGTDGFDATYNLWKRGDDGRNELIYANFMWMDDFIAFFTGKDKRFL